MDAPSALGPAADPDSEFGAKCARLLQLSAHPQLAAIALPVFPMDDHDAREFLRTRPDDARTETAGLESGYAEFLRLRRPGLPGRVAARCGPAPWIVRSSGAEDQDHNINAGGYDSLVCSAPADLFATVSAVVWSGYRDHALAQQRLAAPGHRPAPIAAFVQPLIAPAVTGTPPDADETPLPDASAIEEIAHWTGLVHRHFGMARLDCEWVLETDAGTVSGTGLTEAGHRGRVTGQLSLGFGFASAQRLDRADNSLVWLTGDPGGHLWRGETLRATRVHALHLVQVRPALAFDPAPTLHVLTDDARRRWERDCAVRPADILIPPRTVTATGFLTATRLDDAWDRYLRMDPAQRSATGHVLVERGSPAEHAAVMFRQYGVAVLRGRPEDVPEQASYLLADPWAERCYFGTGRPPEVQTEARRVAAVPAGCRLLSDRRSGARAAGELISHGRRLTPEAMPGLGGLRALPHLSPAAARRLVERSFLPDPECHLREGAEVASPGFAARAAEAALATGIAPDLVLAAVPDEANTYVRGLISARSADPAGIAAVLPRCARLLSPERLAATIGGVPDVRLAVELARFDGRPDISDAVLRRLVPTALALADGGAGHAARSVPAAVRSLADAMAALDVHSARERTEVPLRLLAALPLADPDATVELCGLARRSSLPPGETARLVAAAAGDKGFAERHLALERGRVALAAAAPAEAPRRAGELAVAHRSYTAGPLLDGDDGFLLRLARCDLIESYDAALKRILLELVERPGPVLHQAYLGVLSAWLELAAGFGPSPHEARAMGVFASWIAAWRDGAPATDYTIEENASWRRLLDGAARATTTPRPPANPHRLHNAIHQWLLATTERYPVDRAPSGVAALHRIADRFCPGGNKLLRLTRDSFELDVPLSLHKASLLFTPDRIEAEWSEQPDVTAEETGRLLAFEVLLDRFGHWFPGVVFRTERLLSAGTWTLRIEARPAGPAARFDHDHMRLVLGLLRTLFDGSYDFSYVPNEEVADLADVFRDPRWRPVFAALLDYRIRYDDSPQYQALETLPLGTAIGMLCTDPWTREAVLRLVEKEAEAAVQQLDDLTCSLAELAGQHAPAGWAQVFNRVRQLALFLAARHPRAAAGILAARPHAPWADALAVALLPRADIWELLEEEAVAADEALAGLVRRHAPHLVITAANAVEVARTLLAAPKAHRRCKQHLAHRYATRLDAAGLLTPLVADLEVVPHGQDAEQEAALRRAVEEAGGRLRADIRSKVDDTHEVFRRPRGDRLSTGLIGGSG